MFHQLPALLLLALAFSVGLHAQALTSVQGVVADPSGAVVADAKIALNNLETGARRDTVSDGSGRYVFPQVSPGRYRLTATAAGFSEISSGEVRLLVNLPATVDLTFAKIGTVAESVLVTGEATQLNTVDASIGNAFGSRPILQLPLEARNVVGLLALQPGVTFIGEGQTNSRNGSVNGGKSDQANVTMDGVDVNDQQERSAFTSVLRATLDSVQEFRVTTTNSNADSGRASGAQIALVTKSGTNDIHGSAYEFHRNTVTTANSFFNNLAGVSKPKLIRNTFGASIGGPVKKNRLFYFFNYEGRRDARDGSADRTIPTADLRQGNVKYLRASGGTATLTPAEIKSTIDPLGIGVNPNVLRIFQSFPLPNTTAVGDGLNTAGFRFNAPLPLRWNTYVTRWDWNPSDSGRHQLFVRANLQNDHSVSMPQLPGEPPSSVNLNNSKGIAAGYNLVVRPNLIGTMRYGFTRQGVESTGVQTASYISFLNLSDRYGQTTGSSRLLPVHNPSADFTWMKGSHNVQFGTVMRFITNSRNSYANSFHSAQVRSTRLRTSGSGVDPADIAPSNRAVYREQMVNVLGLISTGSANYNYDLSGNVAPVGAPVVRNFALNEYGMYVQDTWKLTRTLTLTAGLRWELSPPIRERDGLQIALTPSLGAWFDERGGLAQAGKPASAVTPIKFVPVDSPGGTELYAFHKKNFSPRLAVAWSPNAPDGFWRKVLGAPGQTAIRAGWGMYYEMFGNSLILRADSGGLGLSSSTTVASVFDERTAPRFTGLYDIPSAVVGPPTKYTFPIQAPNNFAYGGNNSNIDSQIRPPYTMNMNFSFGREFKGGLFMQGSYVGRLSRRSLAQTDPATPLNLKDPSSGVAYFDAAQQLARLAKANTPVANVQRIPYWENLFNPSGSLTATQYVYQAYQRYAPDYATALEQIDRLCNPCLGKLGPYAFFDKQYASVTAWRSIAGGSYHAMQWTVRQRLGSSVEVGFNYTWSKSIDLTSRAENDGTGSTFGFITNPWQPWDHKGVSDYDMTHQWNANWVAELPFGKGKKFLNRGGVLDFLLGGWQISGIYRHTTGMPISVRDGSNWPTNYQWQGWGTMIAPIPGMETTKNAPANSGQGGPNLFKDPAAAFAAFDFTMPGGVGNRNILRSDGLFNIDTGLAKRFKMPYSERHSIQIRWETFNLTNTASFDVGSVSVNLGNRGNFGKYSDTLTSPRVMQFGARYEW